MSQILCYTVTIYVHHMIKFLSLYLHTNTYASDTNDRDQVRISNARFESHTRDAHGFLFALRKMGMGSSGHQTRWNSKVEKTEWYSKSAFVKV